MIELWIPFVVVALFCLTDSAVGAQHPNEPPAFNCSSSVNRYLDLTRGATARELRRKVEHAKIDANEAQQCLLHQPSTAEERSLSASDYAALCARRSSDARRKLDTAVAALESHEAKNSRTAVELVATCWKEAMNDESTLVAHLHVLQTTAVAVLHRVVVVDYAESSLSHFNAYVEEVARRVYLAYLRLVRNEEPESGRNERVNSGGEGQFRSANIVLGAIVKLLPAELVVTVQCIGQAVGPMFILASIGTIVVLFLPLFVGYFIIGEVMLRFWVKVLLLDGIVGPMARERGAASLVSLLWEEFGLIMVGYAFGAVGCVALFCVVAYPWYAIWVDAIPQRKVS